MKTNEQITLRKKRVPKTHGPDEDCNCEAVGFAKGWNANVDLVRKKIGWDKTK